MNVRMTAVSKAFGEVRALDGVDFVANSGGLHALVGENGAGKTTLARVLYGDLQPDGGSIELDGQRVAFKDSREAISAGIGMVTQHYTVIPELSCLENLMLGAEPSWLISHREAEARAVELAGRMGYTFDWRRAAGSLSPAGKQKLEVLKLLWRDSRLMILDEPTAMLSPSDSDALFENLKTLAGQGATVIVVTHRLPEVMDHCQTVTVLRSGRLVASMPVAGANASQLAELIVGHPVARPPAEPLAPSTPMLVVKGLSVTGSRGEVALKAASFNIAKGEILGVAGVDGNGQRELFEALTGVVRAVEGEVHLAGTPWTDASPAERLRQGLRLIPEDRHAEGVVETWNLEENAALGRQTAPPFAKGRWVDRQARRATADHIASRFGTKRKSLSQRAGELSGGNQQRFVAGRALEPGARLILAFQPTRGLDLDASLRVYAAIRRACRSEGACALVVSFDLDEILNECDRVLALSHGRLVEPPEGKGRDRQTIGRLMVGAA